MKAAGSGKVRATTNPQQTEGSTMKRMMTLLAVAGLALGLAPAALAGLVLVYTEGFDDGEQTSRALSASATGWGDSFGNTSQNYNGVTDYSSDGDSYWVQTGWYNQNPRHAVSDAGEYTIKGHTTNPATITLDWAASYTFGMRILVEIAGEWYGSGMFGTTSDTHGVHPATSGGTPPSEWREDSISTSDTWYKSTMSPGQMPYTGSGTTSFGAAQSLPAGDITRFGIGWNIDANNIRRAALDNVRITQEVPVGTVFIFR